MGCLIPNGGTLCGGGSGTLAGKKPSCLSSSSEGNVMPGGGGGGSNGCGGRRAASLAPNVRSRSDTEMAAPGVGSVGIAAMPKPFAPPAPLSKDSISIAPPEEVDKPKTDENETQDLIRTFISENG
jgi:hypothetical protein